MSDRPNLKRLILKGIKLSDIEYNTRNEGLEDNLRGGNAGAIINGQALGKCPRLSLLRVHGVQEDKEYSTKLMFEGGHGSEEYLMRDIAAAWESEGGMFLEEGKTSVKFPLDSGRLVTGTPDGLLGAVDSGKVTLVEGVEAKCVSSIYTLRDVAIKRVPKNDHIIQSAFYSMALDVPFSLVYTSRVNFHTLQGVRKDADANPPRDCYDYQGDFLFRLRPSLDVYKLAWADDGRLYYKHQDEPTPVATHLTKQAIVDYYDHVDKCLTERIVPLPVSQLHVAGHKEGYKACQYCVFNRICKEGVEDYDNFVDQAKELVDE